MSLPKYGRVFTEADVVELLVHVCGVNGERPRDYREAPESLKRAITEMEERLAKVPDTQHRLTFPVDEPVFLLRAKDEVAMAGLMGYDEGLFSLDVHPDEPHRRGVGETIRAFEEFERAHPDRMGRPD